MDLTFQVLKVSKETTGISHPYPISRFVDTMIIKMIATVPNIQIDR